MLHGMVSVMNLVQSTVAPSSFICEGCIEGVQQCLSFLVDRATRKTKPLELVYFDVCGPMKTNSIEAAKYFVTFINDFSKKMWIHSIKAKSECFDKFKEFKAFVKNQCKKKIKMLRSDNGGEFMSKQFGEFLRKEGIPRQTSTFYTPQ